MSETTELGLLRACHDLSEGGMAVALAEMAFSGGFGADAELKNAPCEIKKDDIILFSESNTRFIVEVRKADKKAFEKLMKGIPIGLIGEVSGKKDLRIRGTGGRKIIDIGIDKLKEAWQKPLDW
jgi:phosphoribosylformylglycinamidine synthase